jgi:hypothetical protein
VQPEPHPDADTLTAYVERLLPAAERKRVLEHLAACADCREVTALAFPDPAQEQDQRVATPATRHWGFLRAPGFIRATVSLAAVVLIAGLIFQFRERPADRAKTEGFVAPAPGASAEKDRKENAPASEAARLETPAQPSDTLAARGFSAANETGREALADNRRAPSSAATSAPIAVEAGGVALMAKAAPPPRRDYVNSDFFANNASPDGAGGTAVTSVTVGELPPAPSPRVSNQFPSTSLAINAANTMIFADMPTQTTITQTVKTIAPPSKSSHWGLTTLSALAPKAKKVLTQPAAPPISVSAYSAYAMGGPGQLNPSVSEAAAMAPPLDSGVSGLERSRALSSRALADSSVNARAEMREVAPNSWRISSGRLVRPGEAGSWVEACARSAAVEVTAFAAHGNELWAGGGNAVLLHSRDGGANCEQVTLGASAIGAILRIEARGALVQVKSSSGQTWSSQDGGKTWKMDE